MSTPGGVELVWPVGPPSERVGTGLPAGWSIPLSFGAAYALGIHPGIDISKPGESDLGEPVFAVADGLVTFAGDCRSSFGNVVLIAHANVAGFAYLQSQYAHVLTMTVKAGQRVSQGQQIATVGNGSVAGGQGPQFSAHLHFELRKVEATACHWASGPGHVVSDAVRAQVARECVNPVGLLGA
jgi:murein DD-endopeptidase MepM/ murein hydrolase activator NlpD